MTANLRETIPSCFFLSQRSKKKKILSLPRSTQYRDFSYKSDFFDAM